MDMPVLKIGGHSPRHPLIQGGMGVLVSGPKLAGAVARSGAIGTIASVGLAAAHPDFTGRNYFEINQKAIKEYLAEAREIAGPDGILAVNCMVALTDYELHVKAACEGGAQIIISGAGLPLKLPEYTKDYPDVALVPIVSSAKAAQLIMRRWKKTCGRIPDGFVVETPLYAGGHLGARDEAMVKDPSLSLEVVVPELVSFLEKEGLDIPVIAAGGIWDREDILKAFDLGAKGVQMGTKFAATEEGDADIRFKQAYVDATEDDVVLIHSPAGLPGRALRSPMVDRYLKGDVESKPCMANCLTHCKYRKTKETFCIAQALVDAYRGDWEHGLFFCGSNVTKVNSIEKVEDVIQSLFPE
ncbi:MULTISPECIES: NAD(P)H-dependent flavin oxidoreductase [Dethiosulfovibrio]|uniref:Nitronate monooxygenase family protein n=2 Tax=Dethiosulfovibrio TaxID=47054 RepID=A0ABS9ENI1_9BACT|nr:MULTISPECIES: nitronate monooxygenase family protein [Dethiosulfovibrio]MCF4114057.1 nitronate monooxygenase family protein [Dethiosulfovibrio russensis]MCF4142753.1 nitronate monooxygenase family protein [Dethiosulfovibrio marinus]MCF4144683.1 nitronate monooxygenase family protein [Dethiosulfovibrio acidaminovorans]